ncbi:MAG: FMN-binding protein [Nitrospira sp.]|nr:FMN-binding protein [Nitrospira sp.]
MKGQKRKTLDTRFRGNDRFGARLTMFIPLRIAVILTICSILTGLSSSQVLAQEQPAEQIWDHELNRWLTPEELGHLEIYFTEEEAARVMFPDSEKIRKDTLTLTPEQKAFVEEVIGWKFPETTFDVFIGETKGNIDGYALIQNTIGKHRPITYMVGVDSTGECSNFEVLVYREARGNEIATKRFNYQYQGKTIADPIRINRDIINITGATMSVRSASAGVKRVLVLVNEFYLKPRGLGSNVMAASKSEKGFFEALFGL